MESDGIVMTGMDQSRCEVDEVDLLEIAEV